MAKVAIQVDAQALLAAIQAAAKMASHDDKSVISRICLIVDGPDNSGPAGDPLDGDSSTKLEVVSTDGYRLMHKTFKGSYGRFPNYRQILPNVGEHKAAFTVDRDTMLQALRALPGCTWEGNAIEITSNGSVSLLGRTGKEKPIVTGKGTRSKVEGCPDPKIAMTVASMGAQHAPDCTEDSITYNAAYLRDALACQPKGPVTVEMWGPNRASYIRPGMLTDTDQERPVLLMPIRS